LAVDCVSFAMGEDPRLCAEDRDAEAAPHTIGCVKARPTVVSRPGAFVGIECAADAALRAPEWGAGPQ
jgi:hypothetical protein